MRVRTALYCLFMLLILIPKPSYAGCSEYKVIDYGDRIEAVCVGEPLTEAQKNELDKKKKEVELIEPQRLNSNKTQSYDVPTSVLVAPSTIVQNPVVQAEPADPGNIVVESYDVKYIPSNLPTRNGYQRPGEYSVKVTAKNNGRQGKVHFKLKQIDFQGYETESISFSDQFGKDEHKTVTTHLSAHSVPFIQQKEWIVEADKF